MVTDESRPSRPSRRSLITGSAVVVGVVTAGTTFGSWAVPSLGWFGDDSPTPAGKSAAAPKDGTFNDDLVDGLKLVDKGFSAQPPRPGGKQPLVGVGTRLRNTTDTALWIAVAFYPVTADGAGIPDPDDGNGYTGFSYGSVPIPPAEELADVGIGTLVESNLDVADAKKLAVHLIDFDAKHRSGAQIVTASVSEIEYHSGDGPGVDYLTFTADNPGSALERADYMVHFTDADGATIGGWYADRTLWDRFERQVPDGETEQYPTGTSTHTLPVWLPPDLKPEHVSLYLWATP